MKLLTGSVMKRQGLDFFCRANRIWPMLKNEHGAVISPVNRVKSIPPVTGNPAYLANTPAAAPSDIGYNFNRK